MSWERRGPDAIEIRGRVVRAGSVVRLAPQRTGADILEVALAGRTAIVHEILQDYEDRVQLAVTVTDDPGRDLGAMRRPGHRFFFAPDEVEPVDPRPEKASVRVLLAGIGNVFLGDDGWGVAMAGRLSARALPDGVEVADFGIRGTDLAHAMLDEYDAVVLLDAVPRGGRPGTLYVIEPDLERLGDSFDAHRMDPVQVLALAQALTDVPLPRTLIVGCEPGGIEEAPGLSEAVRTSLDRAVPLVEELLEELINRKETVS